MPIQSQELLSPAGTAEDAVKCALFVQVISRFGKARFRAMGTSMLPGIRPGDVLYVERAPISGLAPGDIAVYLRRGRIVAHRVVQVARQPTAAVITRGDALSCDDPPVHPGELLGRVTSIVPGPRAVPGIRRAAAGVRRRLAAIFRRRRPLPLLQG